MEKEQGTQIFVAFPMTASFFLLIAASAILRYLAVLAGRVFDSRLRELLPRNALDAPLDTLFREFPERLPEFRVQALPARAARVALDTLCCGALLGSLWTVEPPFLAGTELSMLRIAGVLAVSAGFLADIAGFGWLAIRACARPRASDPADPDMPV